jgi:hypothetical protein
MKLRLLGIAAIGIAAGCTSTAGATTFKVTSTTIDAVWKSVQPGDTIRLSGKFGGIALQNKTFARTVTIDATRATFTDTLKFQAVNGVRVIGGTFDARGGKTYYNRAIVVYESSNISFDKTTVIGRAIDSEVGISFSNVTGGKVTNGNFTNVGVGVGATASRSITVTGNKVIGSTSDGYDLFDVHSAVVNNNSCSGGSPRAGAHPDCVQLGSTKGLAVTSDIKIIDNIATGPTQGFTAFLGSATGYERITVSGNIINGTYPQGIACYSCVDSFITGNFLSAQPGAEHFTNLNVIGGSNNVVADNSFRGLDKPLVLSSNYASAYYVLTGTRYLTKQFLNFGASDDAEAQGLVPEPDTWALMLAGFAAVGAATRRSRRAAMA